MILRAPRMCALAALLLLALVSAGCGAGQQPSEVPMATPRAGVGEPRAYRMGFSALPAELTDESYAAAFDLAAEFGDVLLLQRAPNWSEFAGATPSQKLRQQTASERDHARSRGLALFIALDPFDPADRGRIAAPPSGLEGRDLSDPTLRAAFVSEAKFIAVNYKPAYLALGVEVNATYERNPTQYQRFLDAYREAYAAVKSASPETLVFPTFEYEQLLGVVPWEAPHPPRWQLLADFEGQADLMALATYPSFTYSVARKVPPDYYSQIRSHTPLRIAFAAVGYASGPGRDGVNSSTAPEQRRFLQRLLADADALASPLLIWFAGRDAGYLAQPPFDLFSKIGLQDAKGTPKEGWPIWVTAAKRPYDPATPPITRTPEPEPTSTPPP